MITDECKIYSNVFIKKIIEDDFIQGMVTDTLSFEAISHYLKADAIYLEKFSDIYAQLFAKVSDKTTKKFFLNQIEFIFEHEIEVHRYLAQVVGKDYHEIVMDKDCYPSADHYIKHLYYHLNCNQLVYILAAMLACPWIYQQVAKRVLGGGKITADNSFKKWFDFYANNATAEDCLSVYFDLLEKYSQHLTDKERKNVIRVFLESCQHERLFFQMAVNQEEWPKEVRNV